MIEKYDIHYFCYSKTHNSKNKNMKWASTIMMRRENRKKKRPRRHIEAPIMTSLILLKNFDEMNSTTSRRVSIIYCPKLASDSFVFGDKRGLLQSLLVTFLVVFGFVSSRSL